ncbi:MAG: hypothetical protein QM765_14435 [Myxococcales bacterium]
MSTKFARIESYLAALPDRERSFPEVTGRGTLLVNTIQDARLSAEEQRQLPEFIRAYFEKPPHHAAWIPEAHFWSAVFAVADLKALDARAFAAWSLESNRRLCEGIKLQAQRDILKGAQSLEMGAMTWGTTHHGTKLTVVDAGPDFTLARLEYPKNLFNELANECLAGAFLAILEMAKPGRAYAVRATKVTETFSEFRTTWKAKA